MQKELCAGPGSKARDQGTRPRAGRFVWFRGRFFWFLGGVLWFIGQGPFGSLSAFFGSLGAVLVL